VRSEQVSGDESLATAPVSSPRRVHLPALDGMRGIGVLLVLVVHFSGIRPVAPYGHSVAEPVLDFLAFAFGIPLFFVLSGFLITGILLEARDKPGYFRNFFARRILRIFPLYYGVLAILFVFHPAWGRALGATSSPRWLWMYVSNIESARHEHLTYGYLGHFWTLAVEEQYYLVWPFIVLAFRPRKLLAVCAVLGVSSLILRIVLTAGWKHTVGAYVLTPCQLDPLCTGGALAVLVRKWPLARFRVFARFAVFGSLAAYVLLGWYKQPRTYRQQVVGRPLLSCFLFGGVILLAIGESGFFRRVLGARPLTFLGKYSYGLYVFHYILLPFFSMCFPPAEIGRSLGSPRAGVVISILLSIIGTLVVAIASYELFEKRFLQLKKWFGGREQVRSVQVKSEQ
jgi:peptidoglycan/LPS O-acetylase OafA/YrhL